MFISTIDQDLNDSKDDTFTFDNWKLRFGDALKPYHLDYFNRIASSEYLSQNFFKFPTYLRSEISHRTLQDMPIESMEAYVKLRQSLPNHRKPTSTICADYFKKMRNSGKKARKRSEIEAFLLEISRFCVFQDPGNKQNVYSYNMIVAIALVQQHGERLMTFAMYEWRQRSTHTDICLFVNFVNALAESDYPLEWTAAVVL